MLFFDRGLLSMGNILFLSGVTLTIGPRRTFKFFKRNAKGTVAFMGGVALVFLGWPFVGMCVEGYGFLVLFSSFFPTVLVFLKLTPSGGHVLIVAGGEERCHHHCRFRADTASLRGTILPASIAR